MLFYMPHLYFLFTEPYNHLALDFLPRNPPTIFLSYQESSPPKKKVPEDLFILITKLGPIIKKTMSPLLLILITLLFLELDPLVAAKHSLHAYLL